MAWEFRISKLYSKDLNTYEEAKQRFEEDLKDGDFRTEDIEEVV